VEGAFPIGTFSLLQVWNVGNFAYLLGLMHYLDKTAASALAAFRPLLTTTRKGRPPSSQDQSKFAELSYRLTTLRVGRRWSSPSPAPSLPRY